MKYQLVNLIKREENTIFNMSFQKAQEILEKGNIKDIDKIDGQFALAGFSQGKLNLARTLGIPQRFYVFEKDRVKFLVVASRISELKSFYQKETKKNDFDFKKTVMIPAHYLVKVDLSQPERISYQKFFNPLKGKLLEPDIKAIGRVYINALNEEVKKSLKLIPQNQPLALAFSGGIDSSSILVLLMKTMEKEKRDLKNLKIFTLSIEGKGSDFQQAKRVMRVLKLPPGRLKIINIAQNDLDREEAIKVLEDYNPADVEMGIVNLVFVRKIKKLYPQINFIFDGDGGNENLLDYPLVDPRYRPIEFKNLLANPLLFLEGRKPGEKNYKPWLSSGLSRGYVRSFNVYRKFGLKGFSPYISRNVIKIAMRTPFNKLVKNEKELSQLKGQIVKAGLEQVGGVEIPVFPKTRFQEGAGSKRTFERNISITHNKAKLVFEKFMLS